MTKLSFFSALPFKSDCNSLYCLLLSSALSSCCFVGLLLLLLCLVSSSHYFIVLPRRLLRPVLICSYTNFAICRTIPAFQIYRGFLEDCSFAWKGIHQPDRMVFKTFISTLKFRFLSFNFYVSIFKLHNLKFRTKYSWRLWSVVGHRWPLVSYQTANRTA